MSIPPSERELELMGAALREAELAAESGEIPVGALILDPNQNVIATARNTRMQDKDPMGHAEINAIRAATKHLNDRLLEGCTLVVTLEPCVMCAGSILAARLSRIVFGAWDEKAGGAGSVYDLLRDGRLPHPVPEVIGGVRAEECAAQLESFFKERR